MLAIIRKPYTEISLSGSGAAEILHWLRQKYDVEILSALDVDDDVAD